MTSATASHQMRRVPVLCRKGTGGGGDKKKGVFTFRIGLRLGAGPTNHFRCRSADGLDGSVGRRVDLSGRRIPKAKVGNFL